MSAVTIPDDLDAIAASLRKRREDLCVLRASAADSRKPVQLDQTTVGRLSRMDAMQDQAMALASERRREHELMRIDAALDRIDDGEFGFCVACGDPVGEKRLALDPAIATCVRCARGDPGA